MGDFTTTPRTWAAAETVTAALMNTHVRDAMNGLFTAYTSYVPVWTGASTNPVPGNGTITGGYDRFGKLIRFRLQITMGSTTTYGTGQWRVTLPATPVSGRWLFLVDLYDSGTGVRTGTARWNVAGYLDIYAPDTTAGAIDRAVTGTVPQTWATSDALFISGSYEAA